MSAYDLDGVRIFTDRTHGVWTTCDECHEDWWCLSERDDLDEVVSWICSDGCDDEDTEEWDW